MNLTGISDFMLSQKYGEYEKGTAERITGSRCIWELTLAHVLDFLLCMLFVT